MLLVLYRAAARDVTGGMASLNFDATQLKIVSPSNPNLHYEHFETIDFIKRVQSLVLKYIWRSMVRGKKLPCATSLADQTPHVRVWPARLMGHMENFHT